MEGQDLIAIGFVRTSYGVKGDIKVSSYSGETEHFLPLKEIFLKKGAVQKHFDVERVQVLNGDILLKLRTLDSPEAAKMYATWDIMVPREFASPLEEGEFYYCDLFGSVLLHDGNRMGVV
ncbi:MAG: 16S rRNA processing protein RimM, partial [Spirochaetia bacterium]|nr:16S rRNA processing protein RimM [Spirochaetia bacterium]